MTLDKFFEKIENNYTPCSMVVMLEVKYEFEKTSHIIKEILEYNGDLGDYEWLNDWDEGYTFEPNKAEVIGYIPIEDITSFYDPETSEMMTEV